MYEEDESIFRDIDIKPNQTFAELEACIRFNYFLPDSGTGNFFRSDDSWKKVKPIATLAIEGKQLPMLVKYINDPHQRFIYDFADKNSFTFLIELLSLTGKEDPKTVYPVCVKSAGPSPFKRDDLLAHYGAASRSQTQETELDEDEEIEPDDLELEEETSIEEITDDSTAENEPETGEEEEADFEEEEGESFFDEEGGAADEEEEDPFGR
jgi:hypothetical protein